MTVALSFAVTYDYRCPFARNVHEHLLDGLAAGAEWDVTFLPFSLSQAKVEPGGVDVWDDPARDSGLLALQLGVAVRENQPDRFPDAHRALFAVRHDLGRRTDDPGALREVLAGAGVDVDAAFADVESGLPLKQVRAEHEAAVAEHDVWGVPTFIAGGSAAFVRLMDRPATSETDPVTAIERILALVVGWPELNEFKHSTIPR